MEEIIQGVGCHYENKKGAMINTCKDKCVITYCKKCDTLYAINQETGDRTELPFDIQELFLFIKEKDNGRR